jgi:hypothetical protein
VRHQQKSRLHGPRIKPPIEYQNIQVLIEGRPVEIPVARRAIELAKRRYGDDFFPNLLSDLTVDCYNFSALGEKYSLTRERIRQYYIKYLSEHCPRRTGKQRVAFCSRQKPRFQGAVGYPDETLLVWRRARRVDFQVQRCDTNLVISGRDLRYTQIMALLINGKRCHIMRSNRPSTSGRSNKQKYYRLVVSRGPVARYDFYVLVINQEQIYIIPTKHLREWMGNSIRKTLYVSETGSRSKHSGGGLDVYKYRDYWELLE